MTDARRVRSSAKFAASLDSCAAARRFVRETLTSWGAAAGEVDDAQLVVSELFTNAVEHGGGSVVTVSLRARGTGAWRVEVSGGAPLVDSLRPPSAWQLPESAALTGRGLGIVGQLLEGIEVSESRGVLRIGGDLRRDCTAGR